MKPNFRVVIRERGKIVSRREEHNTWTKEGQEYLASMVSLDSFDPDVPELSDTPPRDNHIKYMGFGMGGFKQNQQAMVTSVPLSTVFQIGSTPHGSTGFTFRDDFVEDLTSLELPVTVNGSTTTDIYNTTAGLWRADTFNASEMQLASAHPNPTTHRFHLTARPGTAFVFPQPISGNEYAYMPLSEAGLYLGREGTGAFSESAFAPPVAYVTFDTIQVSEDTDLYFEWDVTF